MKMNVDEDGDIILTEVYSGIGLKTNDGEFMGICMRDSGFEFNYEGTWFEAKQGVIRHLDPLSRSRDNDKCGDNK